MLLKRLSFLPLLWHHLPQARKLWLQVEMPHFFKQKQNWESHICNRNINFVTFSLRVILFVKHTVFSKGEQQKN